MSKYYYDYLLQFEKFYVELSHGVNDHVSASTQNQALCAIVFLYKHVIKKDVGDLEFTWAKKPKRLPVVF